MNILPIIPLLLLISCSSFNNNGLDGGKQNEAPNNFRIIHFQNPKVDIQSGKVQITYKDHRNLAVNSTRPEKLPKGGFIHIYLLRKSSKEANSKNFSFSIYKNGKKVHSSKGKNKAAYPPSKTGPDKHLWWNLHTLKLKRLIGTEDSVEILVDDKISNGQDRFIIRRKEPKIIDRR